ncbi:hypothetical protein EDC39_1038 [Geothermobacter ehrlichii]|uniref:Host factor-I protein n=1 Tax=Geothermobacter ehrlichii TaxID=213224 RepID=A0A5D3WL56_9BACT|nr:hypothetical protein [Geothermobacter ehrlichii]TYO99167.1 hypothetical protein EDC39_1038 [Geothermobacter ehrlichii]
MTERDFRQLCAKTPVGTPLLFSNRDIQVRGTFLGCDKDTILIEVNGYVSFWPREVCDLRSTDYPVPSYS